MKQSAAAAIYSDLTDNLWASMISFEAERCCSGSWRCSCWTSIPLLERRQSLSLLQVAKSPSSHQRGVQLRAPPQFWKQVLTQEFFPHSWKRNCVLSVQVGEHPQQLTTQVVLAAVLTFFRIVSSLLQLRRITSTSEIWTMRCEYDLSTPFFSA